MPSEAMAALSLGLETAPGKASSWAAALFASRQRGRRVFALESRVCGAGTGRLPKAIGPEPALRGRCAIDWLFVRRYRELPDELWRISVAVPPYRALPPAASTARRGASGDEREGLLRRSWRSARRVVAALRAAIGRHEHHDRSFRQERVDGRCRREP